MKAVRYLIFGRVQGVAYRAFARDKAKALSVFGWVKNNPDGSVECVAAADLQALNTFENELKKGSHWSRVDEIRKDEVKLALNLTSFEIRY